MLIETPITKLQKGLAANSTHSAFAATATTGTITKPATSTTRQIIEWPGGVKDRTTLRITPYGGDANNDIVNIRVTGWDRIVPVAQDTLDVPLWVSRFVCEVACTLSNALTGVAGYPVAATEFVADTLALTTGIAVLSQGTADKDVAWFVCDVSAFELVQIEGSLGTGGDRVNWLVGF